MKLDVGTIAFIASIVFACQTLAFIVQYRVNNAYAGLGWWLTGTILQALGFFLMLTLALPPLRMLSRFANPLIFTGQVFLYLGIVGFLGRVNDRG